MSPNYGEVLGYREEDLIGKNIFDYVHPDDKSVAMKEFSRAFPLFSFSLLYLQQLPYLR